MGIFKKLGRLKKRNLSKVNMCVGANYEESQTGKGADIWGTDWLIPVAEEFEWHFYDDTEIHKQYITTKLTDKIFWFIPFTYDEFVFEVPAGTYAKGELTTKDVINLIYTLEHWNYYQDKYYCDDNVNYLQLVSPKSNITYVFGNSDFLFIRSK